MAKLLNCQTCWDMRVDANGKWVGTNERQREVSCRAGFSRRKSNGLGNPIPPV